MLRTAARRVCLGLACAGLVALLSGCEAKLYGSLSEQEANEMVALLLDHGMHASKVQAKDGSDSVMVDQGQYAAAVDLLRAHGLPRQRFSSIGETFKPSGLIASPVQEQARYLWALGQELSNTVSQIDGVLTARVQVVLPDNDMMQRTSTPSSASVFVRYDETSRVPQMVAQIKSLVADSVQGLSYDKVSVILVPVAHLDPRLQPPPGPSWRWPLLLGALGAAVLLALLWHNRQRLATWVRRARASASEPMA
jgi:type III secretion protein J